MRTGLVSVQDESTSPGEISEATAPDQARTSQSEQGLAREEIIQVIEWMFFAYRDFTGDPDALLAEIGFGRAHHRVLHFVNRQPGLRVADLLVILRITKQSLARVLKQLIDGGFIDQRAGEQDRRERRLYPTDQGRALFADLVAPQILRVERALMALDDAERAAIEQFLCAMASGPIREDDREMAARRFSSAAE